ncbi:caskin-2-like [Limulus polyphemus]|uniref:Caskin-2-like n=1 Tax=Limulus polyphemus TaxID=6850 RepID=A0ABM1B4R5_LIMPO|nr:caskin-2-like [Limulus polyphemus]
MISTMAKEHELFQAIKAEDLSALSRILTKYKTSKHKLLGSSKKGIINLQDTDGMSGLHQAALMCQTLTMQYLLENGAHVDIKDNKGMRPLHYSSWQGKPGPVTLLLQYDASVNEPDNHGDTPLHLACQHGHVDVACQLLRRSANPSQRNLEHKTPLDLACEFGKLKVVEVLLQTGRCHSLLEESSLDILDNDRTTPIHLAAKNGHLDVIRCGLL